MEVQPVIADSEQKQKQHFHVLAVDDSVTERKILERLLRESSCKVTAVDSGDKALEYLRLLGSQESDSTASSSSTQPTRQVGLGLANNDKVFVLQLHEGLKVNLIMTDYSMPGMSGYELLKRVKESSWKDIPVVVMSSENVPTRISMCLEEGAEDFLLKPLQLTDLKKIQPHLLKSLVHPNKDIISTSTDNGNDNVIDITINNNNNVVSSKRKAVSPEPLETIPKLKGMTVV